MNSSQDSDDKLTQAPPDPNSEQSASEAPPSDTPLPPSQKGKRNAAPYLLFLLTLVLIVVSVGGTGFWLWTQFQTALTSQRLEINELSQDLSDKASQQEVDDLTRKSQTIASQQQAQTQLLHTLGQSINQSQALIQRNRLGWSIAEVEYLMRIARFRLDLLQDTQGTETALLLADQRLARLDDISLLPVRKALTAEIQSLRDFHAPDKAGILLQIDQVMSKIVLPTPLGNTLLTNAKTQAGATVKPQETKGFRGLLESIWRSISDHISIRHYPQQINDLTDITTQARAAQSIYLNLQNARIAVLASNNADYHQSIKRVLAVLTASRGDTALNKGLEDTLNHLDSIDISPTLPVIGNALTLLQKMHQPSTGASPKGNPS